MEEIFAGTTATLTVSFLDENDSPVTPSSASYSIRDSRGATVRTATPFTPSGTSYAIELTVEDNALRDAGHTSETRIVKVTFGYGAGREGRGDYSYEIVN